MSDPSNIPPEQSAMIPVVAYVHVKPGNASIATTRIFREITTWFSETYPDSRITFDRNEAILDGCRLAMVAMHWETDDEAAATMMALKYAR